LGGERGLERVQRSGQGQAELGRQRLDESERCSRLAEREDTRRRQRASPSFVHARVVRLVEVVTQRARVVARRQVRVPVFVGHVPHERPERARHHVGEEPFFDGDQRVARAVHLPQLEQAIGDRDVCALAHEAAVFEPIGQGFDVGQRLVPREPGPGLFARASVA
jgi:hypothetical protein